MNSLSGKVLGTQKSENLESTLFGKLQWEGTQRHNYFRELSVWSGNQKRSTLFFFSEFKTLGEKKFGHTENTTDEKRPYEDSARSPSDS